MLRDDMVHVVYQCNPGSWFPNGNNRGRCAEGGAVLPECELKQNLAVTIDEYDVNAFVNAKREGGQSEGYVYG